MPSIARASDLDAHAWRTATWSAPFVVQGVLGLLLVAMWLLGKWPFAMHSAYGGERVWMLVATIITTLICLLVSGVLLRSSSPRYRGLSISIAACSVLVLIGGNIFAFFVLR
jgi:hypothetical protein